MTTHGEKASLVAANLIDEQLRTLPSILAAISKVINVGESDASLLTTFTLPRKGKATQTGSGGNIVADKVEHPDKAPAPNVLDFQAALDRKNEGALQSSEYVRVAVSSALVTIEAFLRAHDMAMMRTPEIQFLGHIVDGILNGNKFSLHAGYRPTAAFDGLVIDSALDGKPVFADGQHDGFMETGDALALLQWLSRYLRGDKTYVSGGDAG